MLALRPVSFIVIVMQRRANILRRYTALPEGERPFTAPAKRKHVSEDTSSGEEEEEETANLQGGMQHQLAGGAGIDSDAQSDALQHRDPQSRSGMIESDDTARAQHPCRQTPAQNMYTQRPQLPSDWQR